MINTFNIFGERCSGTNFLTTLISNNFPDLEFKSRFNFEKHAFVNVPYAKDTSIAFACFRNANGWLKSFYNAPHNVGYWVKDVSFSEFLRHEWSSIYNGRLLQQASKPLGIFGSEVLLDRHPLTGDRIKNVVELRNLKTQSYLKLPKFYKHCEIVNYDLLLKDQEKWIKYISHKYEIEALPEFKPVMADVSRNALGMGPRDLERIKREVVFSEEDIFFCLSSLDLAQEKAIGFEYNASFNFIS